LLDPTDEDAWEFAQWGQKVIAVGGRKVSPQIITLGDTLFGNLTGSPPKARHVAVIRNFVVMANVDESGTAFPYRVRWSGINDETVWTTNKVKQSDFQDLFSAHRNSEIQAIRGGSYGVIVAEHSTWTMEYIGSPQIFAFNETLPYVGTPAPHSVIRVGDDVYMLSQNGFICISGGSMVREIGNNRINSWFFDNCDHGNFFRIVGAWDRRLRVLIWIFPGNTSDDGKPNQAVIYSLESQRWARAVQNTEWIFSGLGQSLTLEQLDAITTDLDSMTVSLDSGAWQLRELNITAFNHAHKSGQFDGAPMDATLETTETQPIPYRRALISRARLEVDGTGTVTINCGTRASQSDTVAWGDTLSQAVNGSYPTRCESRYHRFRVNISGGFERAQGVTVEEARDTGSR
jgi:hypothetical protein